MAGQKTKLILGDVKVPVALVKTSSESGGPRVEVARLDTATGRPVIPGTVEEGEREQVGEFGGVPLISDPSVPRGEVRVEQPVREGDGVQLTRRGGVAPIIPQNVEQALVRDQAAGHVPPVKVARGVYRESGEFVDLTDLLADIDEHVKLDGLTIAKAIPANVIPRDRVRGSFYIEPATDDTTTVGMATRVRDLLWTVLADEGRALAVRWTKRTNQALGIVVASKSHGALMLLEVEWGPNMRGPSKKARVTGGFEATDAELAAARDFIRRHEAPASAIDEIGDERRDLQARAIEKAKEDGSLIEIPKRHSDDEALAKALSEVAL